MVRSMMFVFGTKAFAPIEVRTCPVFRATYALHVHNIA